MSECEICCGSGSICLPIHRSATWVSSVEPIGPMDASYREYPCPECSGTVSEQRVAVIESRIDAESYNDPRYLEACTKRAALMLAADLLKRGFIKIESGEVDEGRRTFAMRATLGVVSPAVVASLKERTAQHQDAIAREVIRVSMERINNWGSYYGDMHVRKANVGDEIRAALKEVLGRPQEWREVVIAGGEQGTA